MGKTATTIPVAFSSKMGIYEVRFGDGTIEAHVIDHPLLLIGKLSEFEKLLKRRVVGLDFRFRKYASYRWLLLCAEGRCLIFRCYVLDPFPTCLEKFLADETICFVGVNTSNSIAQIMKEYGKLECKRTVELGHLAARVLKKPSIERCQIEELGSELGLEIKPVDESAIGLDWSSVVFSEEQIKCAMHNVFYSSVIANKLMDTLN